MLSSPPRTRAPVETPLYCTCADCSKPAGKVVDTILEWETRHGHPARYSLHELARAQGYRLVPIDTHLEQTS